MLVVGAGSVGGYFGGRLIQAGRDVTFLVRPARAAQLRTGLVIIDTHAKDVIPVKAIVAGDVGGRFDFIFLAVKSFQLSGTLEDIAPYLTDETAILPVLNGMSHMDVLRERFGADRILGGAARVATSLDDNGIVWDNGSFHDLVYGEWDGSQSRRINALDLFMQTKDFTARLSSAIEREMWEKWAQLACIGAITSLLGGDTATISRTPHGIETIERMALEVLHAVDMAWQPLPDSFRAQLLYCLTDTAVARTSSLYRDMKADRQLETSEIIGDMVYRAMDSRVPVPLLTAALAKLEVYDAQRRRA
ncbi:MAG TPA: 2-dehydropantoate 2-reductase [Rhizomicrobium sp.]|jgi:2-dehydropantoate 2-reductase